MTDVEAEATGLRVLRDRNLWPYLLGTFASGCGTWFQNLAQSLLVYRLTGSTFIVGVVGFSQFAGTLLLAPWAGGAADRYDRRALMIVMQVASIVVTGTLAILAAADAATTPVVVAMAGLLGVFGAFNTPAMLSFVPLLVPAHELRAAIALNTATFNLARAIGPVLGAVVVGRFGIPAAFGINAASYTLLIVALLVVHPRPQPQRPTERPRLRESYEIIRSDAQLTLLIVAIMVVALTSDPVTTLTPGFVTELFHHEDTWVGVLIGAYGTGAVLAAFRAGRTRDVQRTLMISLAIMGVGTLAFALSPNLPAAMVAMVVAGFGYLSSTTTTNAALQLGVEDSQRGRVMAIWSVAFVGVRPFSSLVDGAVATAVGLRFAGVLFALPALLMSGVLLRRRLAGREPAVAGAG